MIQSFVGCFTIQGTDEVKISNPKREKLHLFSIHRIKKQNSQLLDSSSSDITVIFESKEEKQQSNVSTIRLDGKKSYRILNQIFQSLQIMVTKVGTDCVQLFFTSEISNPHIFFTFYGCPNTDHKNIISDQNDKKITNSQISIDTFNSIVIELRRIKKSSNSLLLLCLALHSFFPFSFFTGFNPKRLGKDYFLSALEKVLYIFYNQIGSEKVFNEFLKCIDYIDFQITIDNELSFGIGFFIITFLDYYQHKIFNLSKFFLMKKNYVTFISLLTFLQMKPINETFYSQILSIPLDESLINGQQNAMALSSLYQFLLINCIKNKLKIYFHFTYLNLLQKVATIDELDFFLKSNIVLGIEDFTVSEIFNRQKIELSEPVYLDYRTSSCSEAKKTERSVLRLDNCGQFEKNEAYKEHTVYSGWFKMKLSKRIRKCFRYQPIYIKPLQDVEEDSKISLIYLCIIIFCLLFSVVMLLKFSSL